MQTTHQDWEPSHYDVLRIKDFGFEEESLFWHQEGRCSDPPQHPNISSEQDWIQPERLCKWSDKWWVWEHLRIHHDRPTTNLLKWRMSPSMEWTVTSISAPCLEQISRHSHWQWALVSSDRSVSMSRNGEKLDAKTFDGKRFISSLFLLWFYSLFWWPQLMLYVSSS